jgi:hypothetical protein
MNEELKGKIDQRSWFYDVHEVGFSKVYLMTNKKLRWVNIAISTTLLLMVSAHPLQAKPNQPAESKVRIDLFVGSNALLSVPDTKKQIRANQDSEAKSADQYRHAQKAEVAQINPDIFQPAALRVGSELVLSAFGREISIEITQASNEINEVRSITGQLTGSEAGQAFLSVTDEQFFGYLEMPSRRQELEIIPTADDGRYLVKDIDIENKKVLEGVHPESVQPLDEGAAVFDQFGLGGQRHSESQAIMKTPSMKKAAPASLDVLVVYTANAAKSLERIGWDIDAVISQAFQRANTTLRNSEINGRFELVDSRGVDYLEDGDCGQMLRQLQEAENGLQRAQELRDETQADIVSLFVHPMTDAGGCGGLLRYHPEDYPIGYSSSVDEFRAKTYGAHVIRALQAFDTYTFVHELGHNLGAHHHADQINPTLDSSSSPGPTDWQIYDRDQEEWVTDTSRRYSAGWRWDLGDDSGCCATVMTYKQGRFWEDGQDKIRVPYFSNPELSYEGLSVGDFLRADNARTLNETFETMARADAVLDLSGIQDSPAVILQGALSGSWYDSSRSGEGFLLELAENSGGSVATVYWFTYDDGQPYWLFGAVPYDEDDQSLRFSLSEASGPSFGAGFDSTAVEIEEWGEVEFTFESCQRGTAQWAAASGDTGSFDLTRVTNRVAGNPCLD